MRCARRISTIIVLALLALFVVVSPASAVQACATGSGVNPPQTAAETNRTPVILVHGLWSNPEMWSGVKRVLGNSSVASYAFDYESVNSVWIAKGNTAQRLANTIVCYSKLYGGKKVIVVAHSMGGLLTRQALDGAAYGTFVKDVVGHVITIGTPHLGATIALPSYLTNIAMCSLVFAWRGAEALALCDRMQDSEAVAAMRPGSPQLQALPKLPSGITVMAIAGEVSRQICVPWGCSAKVSTNSDLIVPVASATAEYTRTGVGDGMHIFQCADPLAIFYISRPYCEHNELVRSSAVQEMVKASIAAYLDSIKQKPASARGLSTRTAPRSPSPTSSTIAYEFFGTMTLRLPRNMKVQGLGGEGPNSYDAACADRSACPSFEVYRPNEVGGDLGWRSWQYDRCPAVQGSTNQVIVDKGTRQIGSKTARYYEIQLCTDAQPQIARFWEVTDGTIFVMDVSGNSRWWSTEDSILTAATWR